MTDRAPLHVFHGHIEGGQMYLDHVNEYQRLIGHLEGKQIDLRLGKRRRPRSLSQNAYYWGVVVELFAEHLGYEPEELHDALKIKFLTRRAETPLPTVASTADLDTAEFTDYIERVRRLAAEQGCYVPDPGEVL